MSEALFILAPFVGFVLGVGLAHLHWKSLERKTRERKTRERKTRERKTRERK